MNYKDIPLFFFYKILGFPFRLLPIKKKLVLFESYYGMSFSDSPSLIAKELHTRGVKGVELVGIARTSKTAKTIPSYIKPIRKHSLGELYYLSRAGVLIDNCRKYRGVTKRKGQYYIQTWHGGMGPKKVEMAAARKLSRQYLRNAFHDSRIADLFLSGSKWQTNLYRRSFRYFGRILEVGLPRNDLFFNKDRCIEANKKVRAFYSIDKDVHIALYAPTFRVNGRFQCYDLNYNEIIENLEKEWGGKWVFLVRMHVGAYDVQNAIPYSKKVMNGTLYPEANDLIIASDLIISDYSSLIYDALLINKRILMYASDFEEYIQERGLCFHNFPFPLSQSNKQLIESIKHYKPDIEIKRQKDFLSECGVVEDGHATQKVVDHIISVFFCES